MSKAESADLLLKLYDLRREDVMREARSWIVSFFPETTDDVVAAFMDDKDSPYFRMVISYWDNAAALVNHGAIDEDMFNDLNNEHVMVFAKIQPFLGDIREMFDSVDFLANLEKLVMRKPDAENVLAKSRESMKQWTEMKKQMAKGA